MPGKQTTASAHLLISLFLVTVKTCEGLSRMCPPFMTAKFFDNTFISCFILLFLTPCLIISFLFYLSNLSVTVLSIHFPCSKNRQATILHLLVQSIFMGILHLNGILSLGHDSVVGKRMFEIVRQDQLAAALTILFWSIAWYNFVLLCILLRYWIVLQLLGSRRYLPNGIAGVVNGPLVSNAVCCFPRTRSYVYYHSYLALIMQPYLEKSICVWFILPITTSKNSFSSWTSFTRHGLKPDLFKPSGNDYQNNPYFLAAYLNY